MAAIQLTVAAIQLTGGSVAAVRLSGASVAAIQLTEWGLLMAEIIEFHGISLALPKNAGYVSQPEPCVWDLPVGWQAEEGTCWIARPPSSTTPGTSWCWG